MRAMVLEAPATPLVLRERPLPHPGPGQVLVRVLACGVCRTDLHVVDGELGPQRGPVVPGHEVVGVVESFGPDVAGFVQGQRVGVPWLGWTCGRCPACARGEENLCPEAMFTGWTLDGGYAEYARAEARHCLPLTDGLPPEEVAPLLCAGLIGYRAWRMAGPARRLGLYGFGAAAHILCQVARHADQQVFAFTRPGDRQAQAFARSLGADWAGDSGEAPPKPLDAAILFAPVGALVPEALARVRPGGVVVAAGIHMSDIPSFPYSLLWGERVLRSVANLTRRDGEEFLALAPRIPVRTHVRTWPLAEANEALAALRKGAFDGAAVLVP